MENLHEMGFRLRELKRKRIRLAIEAGAFLLLAAFLVLAGARIDGLEREVCRLQVAGCSKPDTVMIGLKRATLENGDIVMRIGVVGETPSAERRATNDGGEGKGQKAKAKRQNGGGRK